MRRHALALQFQRVHQVAHQRPRTAEPALKVVGTRQHAFFALQRLADNATHPAAGRLRGLTRPYGDGREAQREAIDEAPARVVIDRGLDHHLLRAVAALRSRDGGFRGQGREGLAEDGGAAGVDPFDSGADASDCFEEVEGRVQVYAVSQVEVLFAAGGHDAVEDVEGVEVFGEDGRGVLGEVCFDCGGILLVGRFCGDWGLEDVYEDDLVVVVEEDFGEELAYEAAGACDEDLHCVIVSVGVLLAWVEVVCWEWSVTVKVRAERHNGTHAHAHPRML